MFIMLVHISFIPTRRMTQCSVSLLKLFSCYFGNEHLSDLEFSSVVLFHAFLNMCILVPTHKQAKTYLVKITFFNYQFHVCD